MGTQGTKAEWVAKGRNVDVGTQERNTDVDTQDRNTNMGIQGRKAEWVAPSKEMQEELTENFFTSALTNTKSNDYL